MLHEHGNEQDEEGLFDCCDGKFSNFCWNFYFCCCCCCCCCVEVESARLRAADGEENDDDDEQDTLELVEEFIEDEDDSLEDCKLLLFVVVEWLRWLSFFDFGIVNFEEEFDSSLAALRQGFDDDDDDDDDDVANNSTSTWSLFFFCFTITH
jgi:hypothetical protein